LKCGAYSKNVTRDEIKLISECQAPHARREQPPRSLSNRTDEAADGEIRLAHPLLFRACLADQWRLNSLPHDTVDRPVDQSHFECLKRLTESQLKWLKGHFSLS
jgi:hypothetical protein